MSYQVLARKWRPALFKEMVGQQHVLRALINALENDRLHHAYLFTGTRGVGKTTVARILAKCLNCETGVTSEPCGECGSCQEIAEGRSIDLIEVDAASRTKVEDTRDLLDNVQYAPSRSRYKIYLIDEVHMLSGHSFNALLKTLEEPPPHAKFLLATTDPQKLPATVLSRCLQFNLKNMVPEQIVEHLQTILKDEQITYEDEALWQLARSAEGSMRDALSLTDQAIAFGEGALKTADVSDMLGTVDRGRVQELVSHLIEGDAAGLLEAVGRIAEHAPDYSATLDALASLLHQMTVRQMVPDLTSDANGADQGVTDLAARATLDDVQLWYQFSVQGRRELNLASDPRVGLEMILLRMLAFRPAAIIAPPEPGAPPTKKSEPPVLPVASEPVVSSASADEIAEPASSDTEGMHDASTESVASANDHGIDQVPDREFRSVEGSEAPETAQAPAQRDTQGIATHLHEDTPSQGHDIGLARTEPRQAETAASFEMMVDEGDDDLPSSASWPEFFEGLGLVGIAQSVALHLSLVSVVGRKMIFHLHERDAALYNPRQQAHIEMAFNQLLERPVDVSVEIAATQGQTPAMRRQALAEARQASAEAALAADPVFAQLLEDFDGELIAGSIRPLLDQVDPRDLH